MTQQPKIQRRVSKSLERSLERGREGGGVPCHRRKRGKLKKRGGGKVDIKGSGTGSSWSAIAELWRAGQLNWSLPSVV